MDTFRQDLRIALRGLLRNPGFTAAVVITMALGIGANTAIFSVVHAVLLSPLPYRDGDRLVVLQQQRPLAGIQAQNFSPKEMEDYRAQAQTLEDIVEYHSMWFILLGRGEPERVQTGVVSAHFFDMLGVVPVAGRTFRDGDDKPGADAVLMLSHRYWRSRFGGDPSVVGQVFQMNDRPHTVIGVLPPIPQYPQENDVYMPVAACPFRSAQMMIDNRDARMVQAVARLKPGVAPAQYTSDLSLVAGRLQQAYPDSYPAAAGYKVVASPLGDELTRAFKPTLLILLAAAGFVLLIVCASVANLILARLVRREREMALRTALGAGRGRLFRQLVTESTVLAMAGGAVGLVFASGTLNLLVTFAERFTTRAQEVSISVPVLVFTLGIAMATGLLVGTLPALPRRVNLNAMMQEGGRTISGGRLSFRSALIVAQVAVSFVLLIGAGLMLRSLVRVQNVDPGIQMDNVLTMRVALNFTKYNQPGAFVQFQEQLLERLRSIPEVRSAGAAGTFPLNQGGSATPGVRIEGQPETDPSRLPRASFNAASPGYFQTVGIPLIKGRTLTEQDNGNSQRVALVSQSMARHFFDDRDPVGARISTNNGRTWLTVAGVVGDVRQSLEAEPSDAVYVPIAQVPLLTAMYLVRTSVEPTRLIPRMREAVYSVDRDQPVDQFRTLGQVRSEGLSARRLTATLIAIFAGLALLVTAAGLAGVIAFSVNQRTQEFGVRMALGASRWSVLSLVLWQALRLVVVGLALGIAAALGLGRALRTLLFQVEPTDVVTFAAVGVLLFVVAVVACVLPARRASSVDPMVALRAS